MSDLATKLNLVKRQYLGGSMDLNKVPAEPYSLFSVWLEEALDNKSIKEPNAMCLTTVDKDGSPHSRMILLKNIYATGGDNPAGLVFFSNYDSDKGKQIVANPKVALNFWWPPLYKQVRFEGQAKKLNPQLSDEYFASRDRDSRVGAWASPQSSKLGDYSKLQQKVDEIEQKFKGQDVSRPDNWGGYLVVPERVEFWEGRVNRLHYRVVYAKSQLAKGKGGNWNKFMLAP